MGAIMAIELSSNDYTDKALYTDNSNAQSNRWFAIIDGMPGVEMKLHKFNVPSMSIAPTPLMHEGDTMVDIPGDTFHIEPLVIEFLVDAKYRNFFHVYRWMRSNVAQPSADYRDITILMLDNQGNPQGVQFTYSDCYPIVLSQPDLDSEGEHHDVIASLVMENNGVTMTIVGMDGQPLSYPEEGYYSNRG